MATESQQNTERLPLSDEIIAQLNAKYPDAQRMAKFRCYFGKYRDLMTFEEVAKDYGYARFISQLSPKTNNMYLFQRYFKTLPNVERNFVPFDGDRKDSRPKSV